MLEIRVLADVLAGRPTGGRIADFLGDIEIAEQAFVACGTNDFFAPCVRFGGEIDGKQREFVGQRALAVFWRRKLRFS